MNEIENNNTMLNQNISALSLNTVFETNSASYRLNSFENNGSSTLHYRSSILNNKSIISNILFFATNIIESETNFHDLNKIKLLIVDDNERMLETLSEIFSGLGYDVKTASDGEKAVECMGKDDVELVLMDY